MTTTDAGVNEPTAPSVPDASTTPAELPSAVCSADAWCWDAPGRPQGNGLNAVAAPVWSAAGEVIGALDVSGPAHRLGADDRPELVKSTREAAEELSRRLGYRPRGDRGTPNS